MRSASSRFTIGLSVWEKMVGLDVAERGNSGRPKAPNPPWGRRSLFDGPTADGRPLGDQHERATRSGRVFFTRISSANRGYVEMLPLEGTNVR